MDATEIESWFQKRPKWLQEASFKLATGHSLDQIEIDELFKLCLAQITNEKRDHNQFSFSLMTQESQSNSIRIKKIENLKGVNALNPSKPLEFNDYPITVIFGRNGAGKTGYVRMLKSACEARIQKDILGNVFDRETQEKTSDITFATSEKEEIVKWEGSPIKSLSEIEIYDTDCGLVYINDENEVTIEPPILKLFSNLTDLSNKLSNYIQSKINNLQSKLPTIPIEYKMTDAFKWYSNLSASIDEKTVSEKTSWSDAQEKMMADIHSRLSQQNFEELASAFKRKRNLIVKLKDEIKKCWASLEKECCVKYLEVKKQEQDARKAAEEDTKKVFENAPLNDVGSESWKLLWEAARDYSEKHAYKGISFPNLGQEARCVLCQQIIGDESRKLHVSFQSYVKGELQQKALKAKEELTSLSDCMLEPPSFDYVSNGLSAFDEINNELLKNVNEFLEKLKDRRDSLINSNDIEDVKELPSREVLVDLIKVARMCSKSARQYKKDSKDQNRGELESQLNELKARKWLNDQKEAIKQEIKRLSIEYIFKEADKLTNTSALSRKKSLLAEDLITEAYVKRFREELDRLRSANIKVNIVKTKVEVGKVYHKIEICDSVSGVESADILSEGEIRIVSLAAFLADTESRESKSTFIFDDPISSLDHVYEDATAKRLVELSKNRQVIIFTHRLSLVGLVKKYSEKYSSKMNLKCLSQYIPGEVTDLPINLKRTDKALNKLKGERLAAAKKSFSQGDGNYEREAKALCSDIRILLERIVEKDLINDVVKRFSPEVNTKGRIHCLAKITDEDCSCIDEFMTKYSKYEHSQPDETPVMLPKPDEIETDLTQIGSLISGIQSRNNPTASKV